jgi:hypothetical protein
LGLAEHLINEVRKEQKALIDSLAFRPVEDYSAYREAIGEIRGLQRVIRLLEDLPND